MRTQDPTIRADFQDAINDIETAWIAAEQADDPKKLIAEYLFVATATLFEGYVNDLFVAYINRNSEKFRAHVLGKMEIKTDDEFAKRSIQHVEKSIPHLSVDKIREILDPTGFNVTFPTTDRMKESAGKWLADGDKTRFTGTTALQCAVIDYIKAVRNYLAHRSQSADSKMQEALAAIDLPADLRRANNNVNDVGAYLRVMQNGRRRFAHSLAHIRTLARIECRAKLHRGHQRVEPSSQIGGVRSAAISTSVFGLISRIPARKSSIGVPLAPFKNRKACLRIEIAANQLLYRHLGELAFVQMPTPNPTKHQSLRWGGIGI